MLHIAEPARRHFVLDDGEPEIGALAEEERRSLGPREPARLRHDPVEDGGELAVAADRDPELQQLLEHLRPTLCRGRAKHLEEAPNPRILVRDVHAPSEKHSGCQGLEGREDAEITLKFASPNHGYRPEPW